MSINDALYRATDEKIKAAYVHCFGSEAGWLDTQGSYFVEGWLARAASKPEPLEPSDAAKNGINCMSAWPWKTTEPEPQAQAGEPEVVAMAEWMNGDVITELYFSAVLPDGKYDLITLQAHREAMGKIERHLQTEIELSRKLCIAIAKKDAALRASVEALEATKDIRPSEAEQVMNKRDAAITQANEALK